MNPRAGEGLLDKRECRIGVPTAGYARRISHHRHACRTACVFPVNTIAQSCKNGKAGHCRFRCVVCAVKNTASYHPPQSKWARASSYTHLAKGHPEGWNDAFKSNIQCFYDYILEKEAGAHPVPKFVTFEQALYLLRLTEAIIESSRTGGWVPVPAL